MHFNQLNWPIITVRRMMMMDVYGDFWGNFTSKMEPGPVWMWTTVGGKADNHKTSDARLRQRVKKQWTWHSSAVHSSCEQLKSSIPESLLVHFWYKKFFLIRRVWHTVHGCVIAGVSGGYCLETKLPNSTFCSWSAHSLCRRLCSFSWGAKQS